MSIQNSNSPSEQSSKMGTLQQQNLFDRTEIDIGNYGSLTTTFVENVEAIEQKCFLMIHTHPDEQRLQARYAEKLAVLAKIAGYDAKIVQNSYLDVATGSANWKDWKDPYGRDNIAMAKGCWLNQLDQMMRYFVNKFLGDSPFMEKLSFTAYAKGHDIAKTTAEKLYQGKAEETIGMMEETLEKNEQKIKQKPGCVHKWIIAPIINIGIGYFNTILNINGQGGNPPEQQPNPGETENDGAANCKFISLVGNGRTSVTFADILVAIDLAIHKVEIPIDKPRTLKWHQYMLDSSLAYEGLSFLISRRSVPLLSLLSQTEELPKRNSNVWLDELYGTLLENEIYEEQPKFIVVKKRGLVREEGRQTILHKIKDYITDIRLYRRLFMITDGSSYNSAIVCRQLMEELTGLPVAVELASDFLGRKPPISSDDVCFFISESDETADCRAALEHCKCGGALLIGITNSVNSPISRQTDCRVHIKVKPKTGIAVAFTKAYASQILSLIMFSLSMSDDQISFKKKRRTDIIEGLNTISDILQGMLKINDQMLAIAEKIYEENKSILVMGLDFKFATCMEGALMKGFSQIHCEGIPSGEFMHGLLAMVDMTKCIVIVICKDHHVHKHSLNAIQHVIDQGCQPIVIADAEFPFVNLNNIQTVVQVRKTVDCLQNILMGIPLQLIASHLAQMNIDRNVSRVTIL